MIPALLLLFPASLLLLLLGRKHVPLAPFQGLWLLVMLLETLLIFSLGYWLWLLPLTSGGGLLLSLVLLGAAGPRLALKDHEALMAFWGLTPWLLLSRGQALSLLVLGFFFTLADGLWRVQRVRKMTPGKGRRLRRSGATKHLTQEQLQAMNFRLAPGLLLALLLEGLLLVLR